MNDNEIWLWLNIAVNLCLFGLVIRHGGSLTIDLSMHSACWTYSLDFVYKIAHS